MLVLALYVHNESVASLYKQPEIIWFAVPLLLFWISWIWLKAHRGEMHDDPVVFAIKDTASLFVAGFMAAVFVIAAVGVSV